jgi:hypothetical protein
MMRRLGRACVAVVIGACGGDGAMQDQVSTSVPNDTGTADDDGTSTGADTRGTSTATSMTPGSTSTETTAELDDPAIFDVHAIPDGVDIVPQECGCAPGTDVIYVLSDNAELWSFDPVELEFTLVGAFACDALTATFSMGVDRNAIAWVMFQTADIYTIDINEPGLCVDPGYIPGQMGFDLYGMAFVSEGEDNPCDQLYALRYSGGIGFQEGPDIGALGTVDPDDLALTELGLTDYDGGELTGTGDGRLFAFAGAAPAKLVHFDKDDGSVIDILPLDTLELTNAFAFAFFGGDFYFFTEGGFGLTSQVTYLDYDGDESLDVVAEAPIRIVGAGVSTCAPIIPPG